MKIRYKRSMDHNYMILEGGEIPAGESYQVRMLLENQVQGLLPCKTQRMNGEQFFYYEITGCQSLQNLFEKRKFNRKELEDLFISIMGVMERVDEYLLTRDGLLLQPSCIFRNMEKKAYCFVWFPGFQSRAEWEFRQLTEYILPKIDHTEKEAVTLGYGLYKESMAEYLPMEFLKRQLYLQKEEDTRRDSREKPCFEEEEQERQKILDDFYQEEEETREGIGGKVGVLVGILSAVCLFFIIRNLWSRGFVYVLAGVLLLSAILALAWVLWYLFWHKRDEKVRTAGTKDTFGEGNTPQVPGFGWEYQKQDQSQEAATTMLLGEDTKTQPYLEELGQEFCRRFFLEKEITILGKWKENVDIWVNVPTVSRLHAKMIQREEGVFLVDINSRNGTQINGVWLNPEEEYVLKHGDIVVFAEKKFRFAVSNEEQHERIQSCYGLQ